MLSKWLSLVCKLITVHMTRSQLGGEFLIKPTCRWQECVPSWVSRWWWVLALRQPDRWTSPSPHALPERTLLAGSSRREGLWSVKRMRTALTHIINAHAQKGRHVTGIWLSSEAHKCLKVRGNIILCRGQFPFSSQEWMAHKKLCVSVNTCVKRAWFTAN